MPNRNQVGPGSRFSFTFTIDKSITVLYKPGRFWINAYFSILIPGSKCQIGTREGRAADFHSSLQFMSQQLPFRNHEGSVSKHIFAFYFPDHYAK